MYDGYSICPYCGSKETITLDGMKEKSEDSLDGWRYNFDYSGSNGGYGFEDPAAFKSQYKLNGETVSGNTTNNSFDEKKNIREKRNKEPKDKKPKAKMSTEKRTLLIVGIISLILIGFAVFDAYRRIKRNDTVGATQTTYEKPTIIIRTYGDDKTTEIETEEYTEELTTEVASEPKDVPDGYKGPKIPDTNTTPLTIYSSNGDARMMVEYFSERYPQYASLIQIEEIYDSEEYLKKVQEGLSNGENAIYCVNTDYLGRFIASEDTATIQDMGITDEMYEKSFEFTRNTASYDGKVKAISYNVMPGTILYRKDMAREVFGTDDPDEIQKLFSDWDSFFATAEKLKEKGYYIVATPEDVKQSTLGGEDAKKRVDDGVLNIYDEAKNNLEIMNKIIEKGYSKSAEDFMWSNAWSDGFKEGVFCYFSTVWLDSYMVFDDTAFYQNCDVVLPPTKYSYDEDYFVVPKECGSMELAAFFLYEISCEDSISYEVSAKNGWLPNNIEAYKQLMENNVSYSDTFEGGTPLAKYLEAATGLKGRELSVLDDELEESMELFSGAYADSEDLEFAMNELITDVKNRYSDVIKK